VVNVCTRFDVSGVNGFEDIKGGTLKEFLYSCCCLVQKLSAHAMLTPDFDMRSHFAAVSEFVEAWTVENRDFSTFSHHPGTPTDFRDLSV